MKCGILGGTFNPIHTGHLILAENAYDALKLDQVLFMPSGVSYLKDRREILPAKDRIRMVELAIENNPHFVLSTIETDRDGNSYTVDTLRILKDELPDAELFFIGGADILMSIHTWREPDQILQMADLVIAPRDFTEYQALQTQKAMLEEQYGATVILLDTPDLAISSSMIRERIRQKQSIRYYVPDAVIAYIREHQLYNTDNE
ncbi:MAG: nicotinate-nucleotide adenylyltransferase [Lachnospiraceae bacterium]|nr:nicotinate-nucleotide adenylyltransferase [Lachnospiraceae bacterium]